jgi:hypothetical protein
MWYMTDITTEEPGALLDFGRPYQTSRVEHHTCVSVKLYHECVP